MNRGLIIGIVIAGIILGLIVVFSLGSLSVLESEKDPILEKEPENQEIESNPQGRDLSIEFDEKMGLSAP